MTLAGFASKTVRIFKGGAAVIRAFSLVAIAALFVAAPAAAQQAGTMAEQYAQNMQGAVGQTFEGGITFEAIRSEANTLVMQMGGPSGWTAALTPKDISDALIKGYCTTAPNFFQNGITMRIDSDDGGKIVKGPLVSACPAPAPVQ